MIDVAFQHEQTLGRIQQETKISELNTIHGWASHPSPFILATFLCTLQDTTSERSSLYASCNTRYWARG